ncbi:protein-export chaperone SecB [Pediococcus ethanolidurans]|uniref:protein-export chaperone SecB n=1 Tax=Pediococcus ethanolidurans TaxID=319653 RepID=UPI001C1EDC32|nr:protein-export chaperone SecB [Pediococcus ethanolidurans]MBU7563413.1 protein-export chaperone SecB [Pediococcus ethanolidurans]MCV3315984.1 protein-export chaperone SecB [Pediococcus ethanolidurans]MCV3322248.1 protein-export chaperone SecB [Pediococcus ethanolidurans]MCV3323768.1 protein-export chaperone SecB [Pediococcus ethanolidurans]MCV3327774.1 protein-export chaperone SecB [Pediococcus ethanolidurans]
MSVLTFNGYTVQKMNYERNDNYKKTQNKMILSPKLSVKNRVYGDQIRIVLTVVVGSLTRSDVPFKVSCSVEGSFVYNVDEDSKHTGLNSLLEENCTAILYPYVRALVATLTNSSNEFPGYNMPTVNVASVLKEDAK